MEVLIHKTVRAFVPSFGPEVLTAGVVLYAPDSWHSRHDGGTAQRPAVVGLTCYWGHTDNRK